MIHLPVAALVVEPCEELEGIAPQRNSSIGIKEA
jgi:hypothetical protein